MSRILRHISLVVVLLAALSGCKRIPLHERSTNVNLNITTQLTLDYELDIELGDNISDELDKKINGNEPEYYQALFYSSYTNKLVTSQIVYSDGGELFVPAGDYTMVLYSFGTESTQIRNTTTLHDAEAFTTDITKTMAPQFKDVKASAKSAVKSTKSIKSIKGYDDDPIIHEPDHLYVAHEAEINIPAFTGKNDTITIHTNAKSIMEMYSLEVYGLTGVENIDKVEIFITGQHKSNFFGAKARNAEPANLYSTMTPDRENNRLYTVFGTFGKLPGEDNLLYLDISDYGGGKYRYIYDLTEQFDDPNNTSHKLIVNGDAIDIPKAEHGGGGLAPSVDKWEHEEVDVPLG